MSCFYINPCQYTSKILPVNQKLKLILLQLSECQIYTGDKDILGVR